MKSPAGAVVRLYVDLVATVEVGHVITTTTHRRYRVIAARRQQRGKHAGRQHLQCVVMPGEVMTVAEHVATIFHAIRWYKR